MLRFKIINRVKQQGYVYAHTYLVKNIGMGTSKASKFCRHENKSISLSDLSKLCRDLLCSPNDLFYWEQDGRSPLPIDHPCITELSMPVQYANWSKAIKMLETEDRMALYEVLSAKVQESIAKRKKKRDEQKGGTSHGE